MINISLVGKGPQIECQPLSQLALRREDIEWQCVTGQPFTVDFGWKSPFPEVSYSAEKGKTVKLQIPPNAVNGQYKYTVALFDEKSGKVYTLDPEMIIRDHR